MPVDEGLKKILKIIAKKSNFKTENSVFDNAIVEERGLPKEGGLPLSISIRNDRVNRDRYKAIRFRSKANQYNKAGIEECSMPTDRDIA